ncbi:hypothetical protein AG1IA_05151 [Rhizoctonia solani AG-1 IA]|uniref:Uncharacterized protein n=1 Tax=Thanatephorus cucumeris (strain AG1-IA) TaxID=983506 RepID=L8WWV9_THACA|nr:hypothetical protein AG1IA_05151 [Rhizoctonia solani AG-1 IA]
MMIPWPRMAGPYRARLLPDPEAVPPPPPLPAEMDDPATAAASPVVPTLDTSFDPAS